MPDIPRSAVRKFSDTELSAVPATPHGTESPVRTRHCRDNAMCLPGTGMRIGWVLLRPTDANPGI